MTKLKIITGINSRNEIVYCLYDQSKDKFEDKVILIENSEEAILNRLKEGVEY